MGKEVWGGTELNKSRSMKVILHNGFAGINYTYSKRQEGS